MDSNSKFFKVFAECALVKGIKRSVIYDLPRHKYNLIPNELYDILTKYKNATLEQIKADFKQEDLETIDEYFGFLLEHEYIFYCDEDELELFPALSNEWHYPGTISNAIIDLPEKPNLDYVGLVAQLEELGCQAIILRFKGALHEEYHKLFKYINECDLRSAQLQTSYHQELGCIYYENLLKKYLKIRACVIYGSPEEAMSNTGTNGTQLICNIKNLMTNTIDAMPAPNLFHVNLELFTESQYCNPYFNGKIYIDETGNIKNCFSHQHHFGSVKENDIRKLINNEFKQLWNVSKDKIAVCQDCEYRFMCVDNRTPIFDGKIYRHLTDCNYDPYEAKWKS